LILRRCLHGNKQYLIFLLQKKGKRGCHDNKCAFKMPVCMEAVIPRLSQYLCPTESPGRLTEHLIWASYF
jgi:hypothetical protein